MISSSRIISCLKDILDRKKILKGLISKFNLEDIVSLHNPVCGQDKVEALLKNDIFIQTSRFEGMPLGILEAMSFGLPCIITKGTNLVEDVCEFEAGYDAGTTDQTIADTIKLNFEIKPFKIFFLSKISGPYIANLTLLYLQKSLIPFIPLNNKSSPLCIQSNLPI